MGRMSAAGRDRDRIPGVAEEPDPPFPVLLRACTSSAVHLEMRDAYTPADPWFQAWLASDREEFERRLTRPWLDLIREMADCGVQVRRVRVISEPVTDYVRFQHAGTALNVAAGEDVRWLPRAGASGIALPGNDFWLLDFETAMFNHYSGDGRSIGQDLTTDPWAE